ncbi:MAG: site-specific DNA-methyltransferase [Tenericutes bacterium]|nr:MAG: site-specific DNA-methyltransferase [Mycoplasmatota bacterium]
MNKLTEQDAKSLNLANENLKALKAIFPEAFTEDGVDFEVLRQLLGDAVAEGEEKYGLTWHGKKKARQIALMPSLGTLRPCPEESVDWDTTQNLFIEGDNLEVLKLLQKSYANKVKMIYIDPPYNTGKEFIYPDKFQDNLDTYLRYTGQKDDEGFKVSSNTESSGRYHTNWLNMMLPRIKLARGLLKDDGVIFISINDNEVASLRKLCDEIFGEENFVAQFVWNTEGHTDNQYDVKVNHEYIVLYAKSANASVGHVIDPNTREESNLWKGFAENSITKNGSANPPSEVTLPIGFPCKAQEVNLPPNTPDESYFEKVRDVGYVTRQLTREFTISYPIRKDLMRVVNHALTEKCKVFSGWANVDKLRQFINGGCKPIIEKNGSTLTFYLSERGVIYYRREREKARNVVSVLRNMGTTEQMRSELERMGIPFQYPKPKQLLSYILRLGAEPGGYVMDFFSGSCTTAHSVLELNLEGNSNLLNFIMVQLPEPLNSEDAKQKPGYDFCQQLSIPENIAEIAKERIRRCAAKIKEENPEYDGDLGFKVFKLDSSNIRAWNPDRNDLEKTLFDHMEHLVKGRSEEDVLYELLLKRGVDLTVPIEEKTITGKTVYSIGYGVLFVCLDSAISREQVEDLAMGIINGHKELEPVGDTQVVFRDSAFANDIAKTNMTAILEQHGIAHVRSL